MPLIEKIILPAATKLNSESQTGTRKPRVKLLPDQFRLEFFVFLSDISSHTKLLRLYLSFLQFPTSPFVFVIFSISQHSTGLLNKRDLLLLRLWRMRVKSTIDRVVLDDGGRLAAPDYQERQTLISSSLVPF
jgi:hypothetical protein